MRTVSHVGWNEGECDELVSIGPRVTLSLRSNSGRWTGQCDHCRYAGDFQRIYGFALAAGNGTEEGRGLIWKDLDRWREMDETWQRGLLRLSRRGRCQFLQPQSIVIEKCR